MRAVLKIGGGILRNREDLETLFRILTANSSRENVLVVSALNGVTDALLNAYASGTDITDELRAKHASYFDAGSGALESAFAELSKLLRSAERKTETKERVASFGERLSAILISEYLKARGINAVAMTAEDCGIVSNGKFEQASCVLGKTKENFRKNVNPLIPSAVPVITGFYGVDGEGNVNTFGRGGSDYSAAVVAVASDAQVLEIWKDVEGFMTADPRVVKNAAKLEEISFEEAKELGYMGAKILHPRTMDPLEGSGISVQIKSVLDPAGEGTRIVEKKTAAGNTITSIAAKKKIAVVNVKGSAMVNMPGVAARVFGSMAESGISVDTIATSQVVISFTIEEKDAGRAREALEGISRKIVDDYTIKTGYAAIGVVGEGMKNSAGTAGRVLNAVAGKGTGADMISYAASGINITLVVNEDSADECIRAIHEEFKLGRERDGND